MTIQVFYERFISPNTSEGKETVYYRGLLALTKARLHQIRAAKLNVDWTMW